ncbi:unnamed protein product [Bemisia tabaci]|uniref:RING-type domain-containing protein n=1 Tax=Bemisia tabaci TaxID=7038 RepID=A0A9P0A2V6_BEMTA|nr:unnamed protein product [Bemisia tabaci]
MQLPFLLRVCVLLLINSRLITSRDPGNGLFGRNGRRHHPLQRAISFGEAVSRNWCNVWHAGRMRAEVHEPRRRSDTRDSRTAEADNPRAPRRTRSWPSGNSDRNRLVDQLTSRLPLRALLLASTLTGPTPPALPPQPSSRTASPTPLPPPSPSSRATSPPQSPPRSLPPQSRLAGLRPPLITPPPLQAVLSGPSPGQQASTPRSPTSQMIERVDGLLELYQPEADEPVPSWLRTVLLNMMTDPAERFGASLHSPNMHVHVRPTGSPVSSTVSPTPNRTPRSPNRAPTQPPSPGSKSLSGDESCSDDHPEVCHICAKSKKNTILLPCKHEMCTACTARMATEVGKDFLCPWCRGKVEKVLRKSTGFTPTPDMTTPSAPKLMPQSAP